MRADFNRNIGDLQGLTEAEVRELERVTEKYPFLSHRYYLSLIDWNDPKDPVRRAIIPSVLELEEWGRLDASGEQTYTVMPGLQHKYKPTALLLVSNACASICRYCFRKRIFMSDPEEILQNIPAAVEYIRNDKEINNVLLTGGDPLMLPTANLEDIVSRLTTIDHVQIIRIGSRMLSFNPYRVLDDPSLVRMVERHSSRGKAIYLMTHFLHPREMTDQALEAANLLRKAGALICNQNPMIRGINDNAETLVELFHKLAAAGIAPYYLFQCRPSLGNKTYAVPIEEGYDIFEQARGACSGLAKRVRFMMSHYSGKIEIVGKTDEHVYLKYHSASRDVDTGRFLVFGSNPDAYWLDDYEEVVTSYDVSFQPTSSLSI